MSTYDIYNFALRAGTCILIPDLTYWIQTYERVVSDSRVWDVCAICKLLGWITTCDLPIYVNTSQSSKMYISKPIWFCCSMSEACSIS